MKALITGADGFLGRFLVKEFERRGHQLRSLGRVKVTSDSFIADLESENNLIRAFEEIDVLVHLAPTLTGTERLLEAMSHSMTNRIIFISSFSVYDFHTIKKELTEESLLETRLEERDAYAQLKIAQELLVREVCKKNRWDLTVLRPAMIWGDNDRYPSVLAVQVGMLNFVIGPTRSVNLIHVKNCAKAIVTAAEKDSTKGEIINLVDNFSISTWKFMGNYLKKGIRIPIPYWFGYGLVRLFYPISKHLPQFPSILSPRCFEARFKNFSCSDKKLTSMLRE